MLGTSKQNADWNIQIWVPFSVTKRSDILFPLHPSVQSLPNVC